MKRGRAGLRTGIHPHTVFPDPDPEPTVGRGGGVHRQTPTTQNRQETTSLPPSSPTPIGDPGGRDYHPNPRNHQPPSHPNTRRSGGFQTRLGERGARFPPVNNPNFTAARPSNAGPAAAPRPPTGRPTPLSPPPLRRRPQRRASRPSPPSAPTRWRRHHPASLPPGSGP